MITEDKITEIFCVADDFCKEFNAEIAKGRDGLPKPFLGKQPHSLLSKVKNDVPTNTHIAVDESFVPFSLNHPHQALQSQK